MTAPRKWLSVAEVCADLQITEAEWREWRDAGNAPLHVVQPDGQERVYATAYERWLDSLEVSDTAGGDVSPEALADASGAAGGDASRLDPRDASRVDGALQARRVASVADGHDASPRAGRDASRSTVAGGWAE